MHAHLDHLTNAWKGTIATALGVITGASLEHINQLASIFAHVCAGLAALSTVAYTLWCVFRRKPPQDKS